MVHRGKRSATTRARPEHMTSRSSVKRRETSRCLAAGQRNDRRYVPDQRWPCISPEWPNLNPRHGEVAECSTFTAARRPRSRLDLAVTRSVVERPEVEPAQKPSGGVLLRRPEAEPFEPLVEAEEYWQDPATDLLAGSRLATVDEVHKWLVLVCTLSNVARPTVGSWRSSGVASRRDAWAAGRQRIWSRCGPMW